MPPKQLLSTSGLSNTQLALYSVLFVIVLPLAGAFIFTTINVYDKLDYVKSAYINKLLSINAVQGDGTSHNIQLFSNTSELSITSNPITHSITLKYNNSLIEFRVNNLEQNLLLVEDLLNMTSANGTGFLNMVSANFTTVNIQITNLEGNITTIFGSLSLINTNLTTILGSFSLINGNITNILGSLSLIYTNLTTIETDISIINGNITNIQTQLDGKLSSINNITGDANKNIRVVSANDNMQITSDQGTNTITFNVSESLMNLVTENGTAMPDMMGQVFMAGGSEGLVHVNTTGPHNVIVSAQGAATVLNNLDMMIMQLSATVVSQNSTINNLNSRITTLENFMTNILNFNVSGNLNTSIANLVYNVTQLQSQVESLQTQLSLINTNASAVPTGTIVPFGGATFGNTSNVPVGYLACDGSTVLISNYAALWSVIGTAYCTSMPAMGDFCLPDLRGNVPVGQDGAGTFSVRGMQYGAETHTLTTSETALPGHTHVANPPSTNSASIGAGLSFASMTLIGNDPGFAGPYVKNCEWPQWTNCGGLGGTCSAGRSLGTDPQAILTCSNTAPTNNYLNTLEINNPSHSHTIPTFSTNANTAANATTPVSLVQASLTVNYIIKY
jgi:microcystin-dependent protein/uncharacterized coiled-coil protein SlyX